MTTTPKARPAGRRRDPAVDRRAIEAVLDLYNRLGLAGVSFEGVAKHAAVGKAALYSRWSSVEALLVEALTVVAPAPVTVDTGDVARDLRQLILVLIDLYTGPHGNVVVRVNLDAQIAPGLRPHYNAFSDNYIRAARAIVKRGVARGELVPDVNVTTLLEQLFGATMLHVHYSDPDRKILASEASQFADDLVRGLLRGAAHDS